MSWYPGAIRKNLNRSKVRMTPVRINLHTAVADTVSLARAFQDGPFSHFFVREDGQVEQYQDTLYRAGADYNGNPNTVSVETWDPGAAAFLNGKSPAWTEAQLVSLVKLCDWLMKEHPSIPRTLAKDNMPGPTSQGLSWHRLGVPGYCDPSGILYSTKYRKSCPGDTRIAQIKNRIWPELAGAPQVPSLPTLRLGATGDAVMELRQLLASHGFVLVAEPVFTEQVDTLVRAFQAQRRLIVDGIVGGVTWSALHSPVLVRNTMPIVRKGSQGTAVEVLQARVNQIMNAKLSVDGAFGPATESAVKSFQHRAGLTADGIVGPGTWRALGYR